MLMEGSNEDQGETNVSNGGAGYGFDHDGD